MASEAHIKAVITAEDKASSVISGVGTSFTKLTGAMAAGNLIANGATAAFRGLSRAFGGVIDFALDALDAYNKENLAVTRLQAGINNVRSATDKHIDSMLNQAAALQKVTRFADEQYISAQGILSTFQLNQDAIQKITPRLADMAEGIARVSGTMPDLEGNAILVAKAIGGEDVAGLTGALRRVGVVMTKHQEEMLATGDVQQRVSAITQILDDNFKGLAEAAGTTTAGKMTILSNSIDDLKEKLGGAIATAITPFIERLTRFVQSEQFSLWVQRLADKIQQVLPIILQRFQELIEKISAKDVETAISGMITAFEILLRVVTFTIDAIRATLRFFHQDVANVVYFIITIPQKVVGAFVNLAEAMTSPFRAAFRAIASLWNNTIGKIGFTIPDWIPIVGGKKFNVPNVPLLAEGGVVTKPTLAMIGEAGPEAVVPLNKAGAMGDINITIQAGALMGSDVEARKFASLILQHMKDAASSKNMTLANMIGM